MSRASIPKHLREVLKLLPPGWSADGVQGNSHWRLRHSPTGAWITISSSPSCDRRGNILASARRAIRELGQPRR